MGTQGFGMSRSKRSLWEGMSHHMSYHTCPGCLFTQHHRLVQTRVRLSSLHSRHIAPCLPDTARASKRAWEQGHGALTMLTAMRS